MKKGIGRTASGIIKGLCLLAFGIILVAGNVFAQTETGGENEANRLPDLVRAVMCEGIHGNDPATPAIVFSIRQGKVFCFTEFDGIQAPGPILHKWFRRDTLSESIKLNLQPGRWATYSSISLRESDRGPWRVEVTDSRGNIFAVLRFSVVE
jgi:hypothetical protein